ncbi:MAG TPA: hypothetical protein VGL39_27235 [Jatrophihabitantaceae bacterium]|jgi:hypothetical protein
MRTEQDLRAAFTVLEDNAPLELSELVEIADEPRPRRRLRNNLTLAAVAATVVAVAAGAPLLVSGHHASQQPQVPPPAKAEKSVTVRYSFTVGHVAGYTITPTTIHRDIQQASISIGTGSGNGSTNGPAGALYVFARGGFNPTDAKAGHPVTVNGHGGYFATLTSPSLLDDRGNPAKLPAVAWQFAPDTWAMVQADFRDLEAIRGQDVSAQAEELKIARAVHTDAPQPLRVPFRFGYLPPGLVTEGGAPDQDGAWIYLGDGRRSNPHGAGFGSALSVWVYGAADPDGVFCEKARPFKVNGYGGCFTTVDNKPGAPTASLYLNVDGGLIEMLVDAEHVGIYSDAQLERIATSLHLATIHDPSTWFDATTAVPR